MKNIVYIIASVLLFSCKEKFKEGKFSNIDSTVIKLQDTAFVSVNKLFLDQFKTISPDTLLIEYPADSAIRPANSNKIFCGFTKLFPKGMNIGNPERPLVYALSKFDIDKKRLFSLPKQWARRR